MARSKETNKAISIKVFQLMQEGFDKEQATAIAFRMYRDGELRTYRAPTRAPTRRRGRNQKKVSAAMKLLGLGLKMYKKR